MNAHVYTPKYRIFKVLHYASTEAVLLLKLFLSKTFACLHKSPVATISI